MRTLFIFYFTLSKYTLPCMKINIRTLEKNERMLIFYYHHSSPRSLLHFDYLNLNPPQSNKIQQGDVKKSPITS